MAHHASTFGYHALVRRLNKFPQGAPPSVWLHKILKNLFSEEEARLVAQLPVRWFSAEKAARAWGMPLAAARKKLDALCRRALLVDIEQHGEYIYCLPPPMAGFLEFSMMRVRHDINQKAMAELLYRYINVEEDFAKALFARGETQLGRVFVNELQIPETLSLDVLDYERASHILRRADPIGISLCYCRHKQSHLGLACQAPQEICMTLNITAASLIRHGHARAVEVSEALDLLNRAYAANLVQFGENVRQEPNFICNCCKCCCEAMVAARKFAIYHPVNTSGFLPRIDPHRCTGCGKCLTVCPVEAMNLSSQKDMKHDRADVNTEICLGCGVCSRVCPTGAITLQKGSRRVMTPLNTAHRVVLMAIERNTLQHILFDNQTLDSHRAMAAFLGVVFKLSPVKQLLANRQLRSRYLETMIERLKWQPEHNNHVNPQRR